VGVRDEPKFAVFAPFAFILRRLGASSAARGRFHAEDDGEGDVIGKFGFAGLGLALTIGAAASIGSARAQDDCNDTLLRLSKQRDVELNVVNDLVKAQHGKPLDPAIACAKSAGLNKVESEMLAFMDKNKDWCSIPDDSIAQLKANHARSLAFASRACNVAAQMRKMKEQAASGGGPQAQPLPTGPL
jgi:hypothetical protein